MFNFVMKIVLETIEIITKAVIIKNNKQHSRLFNTNTTSSSSSSATATASASASAYSITVAASTSSYRLLYIALIVKHGIVMAAPQHEKYINRRIWPPMKNYDIWSAVTMDNVAKQTYPDDPQLQQHQQQQQQQHYQHHDKAFQNDQSEFVSQQFKENIDYWHSNYNNINNNIHHHDHHINTIENNNNNNTILNSKRRRRVLHLFPVPVDGECLADDGRRTGTCHNAYECRMKGGAAKGECAMGFGVCCIFTANCSTDTIIGNNITYLVSPNFPTFMPQNLSSCSLKVKLMDADISQLRIDFIHFSLGQPNRRTGVCDGDVFNVSGGPGGTFSLCGQNSGQHIYYDVGGRSLPRQTLYGNLRPLTLAEIYPNLGNGSSELPIIEISMNFTARFLPQRLWEIRISQIPFSQRAPAGCLQYFTGNEGVLQTFNFADNGRHLANQNYRICMRQETNMCSILYQPCDDQSFRIGPMKPPRSQMSPMMTANSQNINNAGGSAGGGGGGGTIANNGMFGMPVMGTLMGGMGGMVTNIASTMASMLNMGGQNPMGSTTPMMSTNSQMVAATATTPSMAAASSTATNEGNLPIRSTVAASTTPSTPDTPNTPNTPSTPLMNTAASSATSSATNAPQRSSTANTASTTPSTTPSSTASTTVSSSTSNDDYEDDEGSGAGISPSIDGASRRPPLATGGFDLLGFLRSAFDYNRREGRQLMSNCRDRITMPCIIEDFIGTGLGPLPGCEPVHCGAQFCASGLTPCRIESTVTPFYMGIHFGDGSDKGSAEDNIGACIRFNQVKCM